MLRTANLAARYGSSPYPSKVRPFTGTRAMLTVGPSRTLRPTESVSAPSMSPYASAWRRSHDAASEMGAGRAVADGCVMPPVLTPAGPLVSNSFGMPRRGIAGTAKAAAVASATAAAASGGSFLTGISFDGGGKVRRTGPGNFIGCLANVVTSVKHRRQSIKRPCFGVNGQASRVRRYDVAVQ